jgi:hypothetical protein
MICIFCDKEVLDDIFTLGIDIPYINLKVHKYCWKMHKNTNYLQQNAEVCYNRIVKIIEERDNGSTRKEKKKTTN